jgi:hypothetical protein
VHDTGIVRSGLLLTKNYRRMTSTPISAKAWRNQVWPIRTAFFSKATSLAGSSLAN